MSSSLGCIPVSARTLSGKFFEESRTFDEGMKSRGLSSLIRAITRLFAMAVIPLAAVVDVTVTLLAIVTIVPLCYLDVKQHFKNTAVAFFLLVSTPIVMILYLVSGGVKPLIRTTDTSYPKVPSLPLPSLDVTHPLDIPLTGPDEGEVGSSLPPPKSTAQEASQLGRGSGTNGEGNVPSKESDKKASMAGENSVLAPPKKIAPGLYECPLKDGRSLRVRASPLFEACQKMDRDEDVTALRLQVEGGRLEPNERMEASFGEEGEKFELTLLDLCAILPSLHEKISRSGLYKQLLKKEPLGLSPPQIAQLQRVNGISFKLNPLTFALTHGCLDLVPSILDGFGQYKEALQPFFLANLKNKIVVTLPNEERRELSPLDFIIRTIPLEEQPNGASFLSPQQGNWIKIFECFAEDAWGIELSAQEEGAKRQQFLSALLRLAGDVSLTDLRLRQKMFLLIYSILRSPSFSLEFTSPRTPVMNDVWRWISSCIRSPENSGLVEEILEVWEKRVIETSSLEQRITWTQDWVVPLSPNQRAVEIATRVLDAFKPSNRYRDDAHSHELRVCDVNDSNVPLQCVHTYFKTLLEHVLAGKMPWDIVLRLNKFLRSVVEKATLEQLFIGAAKKASTSAGTLGHEGNLRVLEELLDLVEWQKMDQLDWLDALIVEMEKNYIRFPQCSTAAFLKRLVDKMEDQYAVSFAEHHLNRIARRLMSALGEKHSSAVLIEELMVDEFVVETTREQRMKAYKYLEAQEKLASGTEQAAIEAEVIVKKLFAQEPMILIVGDVYRKKRIELFEETLPNVPNVLLGIIEEYLGIFGSAPV